MEQYINFIIHIPSALISMYEVHTFITVVMMVFQPYNMAPCGGMVILLLLSQENTHQGAHLSANPWTPGVI